MIGAMRQFAHAGSRMNTALRQEAGMQLSEQAKTRLAGVFDRASETYGQIGPRYFTYFGQQLVERAGPTAGMHVLDVACGRGAVLFPAAHAVGPTGSVVGIDLSEGMIKATNADISMRRLPHVIVQVMDAERLLFPDAAFDALTCGFALFFLSDRAALAEFRRVVRRGGTLAISAWAPVDPSSEEAARWGWYDDLVKVALPTAPTAPVSPVSPSVAPMPTPEDWAASVTQAGFDRVRVQQEAATFTYATPEEWWQERWSLAFRSALEALPPPALAAVQAEALARTGEMQARGELITELTAVYTLAS
jgi:ubiquinone/menaquinone biosynthesis C-methylase UbiE